MKNKFKCTHCKKVFDIKDRAYFTSSQGEVCKECSAKERKEREIEDKKDRIENARKREEERKKSEIDFENKVRKILNNCENKKIGLNITTIPEVEHIVIKDFGIIKKADIKFSPGLNIIVGKGATGKTTLVNYLIGISDPNLMAAGNKIMFEINNEINKTCILMDDILCRLDNEKLIKILKNLENSNRQVIATLNISRLDDIKTKIKAKIINTESFELKKEGNN